MKNRLIKFFASKKGRTLRVIFGMLLLAYGFEVNSIFIFIGIVPLLAGVFDVCLIAPIFKLPYEGEKLRKQLK